MDARHLAAIHMEPVGRFRAVTVRDGEARLRDGEPIFAVRRLDAHTLEILFADGMWMLAADADLDRSDL